MCKGYKQTVHRKKKSGSLKMWKDAQPHWYLKESKSEPQWYIYFLICQRSKDKIKTGGVGERVEEKALS